MADTKKYISLDKLRVYNEELIEKVINVGDAATLKSAKDYADSLAPNYDAAGAATSALEEAKAYADGKDTAIPAAKKAGDDAATAAAAADAKAVTAQSEVDALEAYVGTIPSTATATDVVGYINEKTAGIASDETVGALDYRVGIVEGKVTNIENDYLKASDKSELEGKITEANTAVATEKARAEGVEADLESRLAAVEGDYLNAADKTELQSNIDTLAGVVNTLRDGVDAEKVDGVKDLIDYVEEHGTEVTGMKEDISENAAAIEGVAGRMTTAEGKITVVEGVVANKAEKTYVDEQVQALQGADIGLGNRISTLEGKFGDGEGSVEDMIADAQAAAEATAAADATSKANAAEAAAKAHADNEISKDRARLDALEGIEHHDHANKAELDLIASGDKAKWDAAEAKAHEHNNKTVLDGITAENVATWNTVTSKAAQSDLDDATGRITAIENKYNTWHDNFTEVSEAEIKSMFSTQS